MINVSGKEKYYDYDKCCVDQWLTVPRFAWTLGHGVGMVAEKRLLSEVQWRAEEGLAIF